MIKILKNVTNSPIKVLTKVIDAYSSKEFESITWLTLKDLVENQDYLYTLVNNGDIVVNDGSIDLSISNGLLHLKKIEDVETIVNSMDLPLKISLQFQYVGEMDYTQYLVAGQDTDTQRNRTRPSGDTSNGYRYQSCAPYLCPSSGIISKGVASIKGLAQTTGTPASSVELKFELWKVGFDNEGTKIGDVIFNIDSSSYTIGTWWNSSVNTNYIGNINLNLSVNEGDLLALKFIRQQASDKIVTSRNTTISLVIDGE